MLIGLNHFIVVVAVCLRLLLVWKINLRPNTRSTAFNRFASRIILYPAPVGCSVAQLVALLPCSKKFLGLTFGQGSFCMEFVGSLRVLWLPPTVKRCACYANWSL
ncbi:hypothetical protein GOODEAATRI_000380 [Goodea atripinnis]|uniref:Secreted protein n=1 Tax=Goodea atripinnis TaxID=208336 RepID=A0ABV0MN69_9TELE